MERYLSTKKAQVWYIDFIIGTLIFILVAVIFFIQIDSPSDEYGSTLQDIIDEAASLSTTLLTSGYPEGWDAENVILIGITDNNHRINEEKLAALSEIGYSKLRSLTRVRNDFFFFIKGSDGCITPINDIYGIGHPEVEIAEGSCPGVKDIDISAATPNNLVTIKRNVIAGGKPASLIIYVWN